MNEKGIVPIIALCVLLALIVGVIITFVVQLEIWHQEKFSQSLLSDDAKIKPIIENLKERKDNLVSDYSDMRERARLNEAPREGQEKKAAPNGDRLGALQERLGNPSRTGDDRSEPKTADSQ
jgi:hypothetical protein